MDKYKKNIYNMKKTTLSNSLFRVMNVSECSIHLWQSSAVTWLAEPIIIGCKPGEKDVYILLLELSCVITDADMKKCYFGNNDSKRFVRLQKKKLQGIHFR